MTFVKVLHLSRTEFLISLLVKGRDLCVFKWKLFGPGAVPISACAAT